MCNLSTHVTNNDDWLNDTPLYLSLFIGNVINFCLYGALTVQLYIYYISFPKDPRGYKAVIYLVYLFETVYTAFLAFDLGRLLLDPGTYITCPTSLAVPICGGAVATLTQGMYAHRIGIITRSKSLSWGIFMVIVIQFIVAVTLVISHIKFHTIAMIWTAICLVVNLTIAVIMIWSLSKDEIRPKQFKRKVTHLLYIIVGTGALTVAVNASTLIVALAAHLITYGPGTVLSKLYANSMMVLVNNRVSLARSENKAFTTRDLPDVRISSLHFATGAVATNEESQGQFSAELDSEAYSEEQKV